MTLRSIDLQSDGDLDSIRNSCDVFSYICLQIPFRGNSSFMGMFVALLLLLQAVFTLNADLFHLFKCTCLQIPPPGVSSLMEMLVALLLFLQAAPTIRSQTTPPPVEDNNDLWALVGAFYQQNIGLCH